MTDKIILGTIAAAMLASQYGVASAQSPEE
jgi:hypothetical protein